jgi:transcription antitermination factor NusG
MLKVSENPPMVPPGCPELTELQGAWWVAHTRARFEKAFAWDLLHRGVGYFLPMLERTKTSGGKKRHVLAPLFSSYVFFCGSDEDRYWAMTTNRLCQTIPVVEREKFIRELTSIQKALSGKAVLDPYPYAAVGKRCRVKAGPFQNTEGVVIQRGKTWRLVLQVSLLGQGAAMEIDADLVEPTED